MNKGRGVQLRGVVVVAVVQFGRGWGSVGGFGGARPLLRGPI